MVAGVLVLLAVAGGLFASRVRQHDSRIEAALKTLPNQTLVASFTDWEAIRAQIDPHVSSSSKPVERADFFEQVYDRDFSTTSVLGVFDEDMATSYGWTVLDSEWEMYGQSRVGAVEVLRMPDDFDFAAAERALTRLGYGAADKDGVRVADEETLAAIAPNLTPQLTAVVLLPDDGVIVTSDASSYADVTVDTIDGERDSVDDQNGVAAMAAALGDSSVTAQMDVGDYGCVAAGFGQADPAQQRLARQRTASVGGVSATHGLTLSIDERRDLSVVMSFASGDEARDDQAARLALARGAAPDQGGTFDERFRVVRADVEGQNLVMVLRPRSKDTQLLRDLGHGGLLFASC
jgi:hypothetical protein